MSALPTAPAEAPPRPHTVLTKCKLTKREIEVLSVISMGHSSKEAADILFVSKRTIDFHLGNIYRKLQVDNRVQAYLTAVRFGLLPFEPVMSW